jgi:hypothetical protein
LSNAGSVDGEKGTHHPLHGLSQGVRLALTSAGNSIPYSPLLKKGFDTNDYIALNQSPFVIPLAYEFFTLSRRQQ